MSMSEEVKGLRHQATLAKWARMRAEVAVDRLNGKIGETSDPAKKKALQEDYKAARSVLSERKTNEARARKVFLDAKKAEALQVNPVGKEIPVTKEVREIRKENAPSAEELREIMDGPSGMVLDPEDQEVPLKPKSLAQRAREMVEANGGSISLAQAKKVLKANDAAHAMKEEALQTA